MSEEEMLNIVFTLLWKDQHKRFSLSQLKNELLELGITDMNVNFQRLVEQLVQDGYAKVERYASTPPMYYISSNGINFYATLPSKYNYNAYTYHLELQKEKQIRVVAKEKLELNHIESSITTNRSSVTNAIISVIFGFIVLIIQLRTCNRDELRDHREAHKLNQDSIQREVESKHDSILEIRYLQILQALKDSVKK